MALANGGWTIDDYRELLAQARTALGNDTDIDSGKALGVSPFLPTREKPAEMSVEPEIIADSEPAAKKNIILPEPVAPNAPEQAPTPREIQPINPPVRPETQTEPESANARDNKTKIVVTLPKKQPEASHSYFSIDEANVETLPARDSAENAQMCKKELPGPEITPGAVGLPDSPTRNLPEPWDSPGGWLIQPQKTGESPRLVTPGAHNPLSTRVEKRPNEAEQDEAQIRIAGFDAKEPPVPHVDESAAEIELNARREDLVTTFRVDITDGGTVRAVSKAEPEPEKAEAEEEFSESGQEFEYLNPNEQGSFNRTLLYTARKFSVRTFWTGLLLVFGVFITVLSFGAEGTVGGVENTVFSMGGNIICLCLLGWLCLRDIPGGLQLLFRGKGNSDSAFALAYIAAFIIGLLPMLTDKLRVGSAVVFTMPVLLAGFWNTASKNAILQNLQRNFNEWAIRRKDSLYAIHAVANRKDAADMSVGLRAQNAPILVSQKTLFPVHFRREGEDSAAVDRLFRIMLPIAGAVSLVLSGALAAVKKDIALALAVLPAAFTALLPISLLAAHTLPMKRLRSQLAEDGAMLASISAAEKIAKAKTLALDGVELYHRQECQMTGFRCVRKDVRQFDAMLYAAAMLREMDGPAMEACRRQMLFEDAEIPLLRDVRVERLGISAKIPQGHGTQTVLLGTLKFLNLREIGGLPNAVDEMKWAQQGLKVLYLAVSGQYQAYMLFSYKAAHHLDKIKTLTQDGMQVLVATRDPNINEQELVRQFKLSQNTIKSQNAIKIATARGEEAFQKYRLQEAATASAAALHDGSAFSFLSLIHAARRVAGAARRTTLTQLILLAAETLLFAVGLLLGMPPATAVLVLFGLQFGGTLLLLLLGRA
ncbi:MAG: hypothetical protein LBJ12_07300 [Oscillospiraceae bacterium]|jgi:uncharacterized membrane protein|nr:hypothetical protein [Oscillospiraceae bacterium]